MLFFVVIFFFKQKTAYEILVGDLEFRRVLFRLFVERCRLAKIHVPIIAGIMPVTSHKGMLRMAELALGARFPAGLLRAIDRTDYSNESVSRVGEHWATEQCRDLLDNEVDGIHFYTLNKSRATRKIFSALGVDCTRQLDGTVTGTSEPAA